MRIYHREKFFVQTENKIIFKKKIHGSIYLQANIFFLSDKFVEYQKDLITEFLADLQDYIQSEKEERLIRQYFEKNLQSLNSKLQVFAGKIRQADTFPIKGAIQLVVDQKLMATIIGDVSMVIFRDKKLYYAMTNTARRQSKIDLFSDFIEGDLESHDQLLLVGVNTQDLLDENDIRDVNQVLASESKDVLSFIEELVLTRVDSHELLFLFLDTFLLTKQDENDADEEAAEATKTSALYGAKPKKKEPRENILLKNKYLLMIGCLLILIFFLGANLVSSLTARNSSEVITTASGQVIDVTIDDIKKEIASFLKLDPTSNEKSRQYNMIRGQLTALEQNKRWPEDVQSLKNILQSEYFKGFNIYYFNNLELLNTSNNVDTTVIKFGAPEQQVLGNPFALTVVNSNINVGGTNGAIMDIINNDVRGVTVSYDAGQTMQLCDDSLLKRSLYCVDQLGDIYLVTKAGLEKVENNGDPFPKNIKEIDSFGSANIYVFSVDPTLK